MNLIPDNFPLRPAWTEIDLGRLRRNIQLIRADLPRRVRLMAVVKDEAYGHGALDVARVAMEEGAWGLGLSTLEEAMSLRDAGITAPLLLLGERQQAELEWCVAHDLTVCVNESYNVRALARVAAQFNKRVPVHVKIHTGMSRYGVRWDEALPLIESVLAEKTLLLEGAMTHFAQSDETDKRFANLQFSRFNDVLNAMVRRNVSVPLRHACNSGGFLDLPRAHLDMVRVGILLYGVFPSTVCRRIPGIEPVMSVKARVAAIQTLKPGEVVGYGMRYTASAPRRVAVLPIGYGDGFPRVRNEGGALIRGKRAPLIGGIAMDALMVDITDIPQAQMWDEAVIMGRQGNEEISARDIAKLKNSVTYDVLTNWRLRLRRKSINAQDGAVEANETAAVK
ncbi:MAG: alanine racemase [Verrucomicrobia bacterium]|nr:alanine racemase [Verrucomicrobiota bacterium]MDE3099797.1 alanine racemase [Verrucomicrobiota bacterium]